MTELPQKLYRAVDEMIVRNYCLGEFWFRSHKWFRGLLDGDLMEGVGTHRVHGGLLNRDVLEKHPGQPAYFMSFSETSEGARSHGREDHCVLVLEDPDEFRNLVERNLPDCGFVKVTWIKIKYGKTKEVEEELGAAGSWHRKYCCKPKEFANEREWRLQIQFMHSFRIQNDTLKFRWGQEIGGFLTPVSSKRFLD